MDRKCLTFAFSFLITTTIYPQLKEVVFKDDTKLQYEVLDNNYVNAPRHFIKLGFGSTGLTYEYSDFKHLIMNTGFSMFSGGRADVLLAFYSYERSVEHQLTLKEVSGFRFTKEYVADGERFVKGNIMGVHLGAKYFNQNLYLHSPIRYVTDVLVENNFFPFNGIAYVAGLGKSSVKRGKFVVVDQRADRREVKTFNKRRAIYADLLYFPSIDYRLYNPLSDQVEPYNDYSKFGWLITFEGAGTSTDVENKKGWGTNVQLGFGKNPGGYFGLLGLGLCF